MSHIQAILEVAERLQAGQLEQGRDVTGHDEIAAASQALNKTVANLSSMIRMLQTSAQDITSPADEIAKGNVDLSTRTERLSAAVSSTRGSVAALSQGTQLIARNASNADNEARATAQCMAHVKQATEGLLKSVDAIVAGSHRISEVNGSINGIAAQTHILALNTAVEAARAGEAGRGFGVVASGVRSPALKARNASAEIRALSAQAVQANALKMGTAASEVDSRVAQVSPAFMAIAAEHDWQRDCLQSLQDEFSRIDDIGQQNAALVEQAAAAAEGLNESAIELSSAAMRFELN